MKFQLEVTGLLMGLENDVKILLQDIVEHFGFNDHFTVKCYYKYCEILLRRNETEKARCLVHEVEKTLKGDEMHVIILHTLGRMI